MYMPMKIFLLTLLLLMTALPAQADDGRPVGSVNTVFQLLGPDHKIKIAAFDDPKVQGVTCYLSRAVTGGVKGALGLAQDPSDASIACRQTGPIRYTDFIRKSDRGEDVFDERRSILFKTLHVTRFYDQANGTLVYLTWSDRLVDGSPKNSISAVPPVPWNGIPPESPKLK
jgi:CreA protein